MRKMCCVIERKIDETAFFAGFDDGGFGFGSGTLDLGATTRPPELASLVQQRDGARWDTASGGFNLKPGRCDLRSAGHERIHQ